MKNKLKLEKRLEQTNENNKEKGKFCANTVYEQKKILLFGRRQQAILFHVIYTIFRFILFFL